MSQTITNEEETKSPSPCIGQTDGQHPHGDGQKYSCIENEYGQEARNSEWLHISHQTNPIDEINVYTAEAHRGCYGCASTEPQEDEDGDDSRRVAKYSTNTKQEEKGVTWSCYGPQPCGGFDEIMTMIVDRTNYG